MSKEWKVRRAGTADTVFLTSISFGARRYWNYPKEYYETWQNELMITEQYIKDNIVYVVDKNDTIIAYCSIRKDETTGYWLDHLFVRPGYMRNGVGSRLIEEVIKFCRDNQIDSVNVLSDLSSKGFYEKIGAEYIKDVDSNIPERKVSLYILPVEGNKSSKELISNISEETAESDYLIKINKNNARSQTAVKEEMRQDKNLMKQKLYELDKDIGEDTEEDISIENFKFTIPIGYKFQYEEVKKAEEEAAAAEETITADKKLKEDSSKPEKPKTSKSDNKVQNGENKNKTLVSVVRKEEKKKIKKTKEPAGKDKEKNKTADKVSVKSEKDKMLQGEEYIAWGETLASGRRLARKLMKALNLVDPEDKRQAEAILRELLGAAGESVHIEPDFKCEYGYNIHVGENLYIDYNCVILDQARVTIGDNCIISPQVGIYTLAYPVDSKRRLAGYEYALPVTIGNNVWIGGGSIIRPGVTIGDGTIIEPGSVVCSDIKGHVIAGGNPAQVIKEIDE